MSTSKPDETGTDEAPVTKSGFRLLPAVRDFHAVEFRPNEATRRGDAPAFTPLKGAGGAKLRLLVRDADEEAERERREREARDAAEAARLAAAEKKAREKGFIEGTKKAGIIFRDTVKSIEDYKARVLLGCREEVIELALVVAQRILRRELTSSRETVVATLWEAIRMTTETEGLRVRVAAEDLDAVEAAVAGYHEELGQLKGIVVEADPSVAPGGCVVETTHGTIDARIDRQFAEIADELRESA
ncbi:MAG: hypothetical protein KC466_18630 [Myxococcales bacterium]|nr:hypothetical protein [Myxococcales bacterium]